MNHQYQCYIIVTNLEEFEEFLDHSGDPILGPGVNILLWNEAKNNCFEQEIAPQKEQNIYDQNSHFPSYFLLKSPMFLPPF